MHTFFDFGNELSVRPFFLFVVYLKMLSLSQIIASNGRMIDITRTGNKMEGSDEDLLRVTTTEFAWSY